MATLADDVDDTARVGSSNFDASPGVAAAAATVALNQTAEDQEDVVYNCRMCRRAVFNGADIEKHEAAQHNFRRRKSKGVPSKGPCSSIFLSEPKRWMKQQAGEVEGKLSCPNKACGARLGSLKWTGAQCSCGSWITPAIQFPRKNLDARPRVSTGPPPGTVVHSSLLAAGGGATITAALGATTAAATDAAFAAPVGTIARSFGGGGGCGSDREGGEEEEGGPAETSCR
ncbi:unnamed protein product [Ectocarpus sp. 12 AP-2014]